MPARRSIAALLTICLTMLGLVAAGAAPAAAQVEPWVTTQVDVGRTSLLTTVTNSGTNSSVIVERDPDTGAVLAKFGELDGTVHLSVVARNGRVYASGNDGSVRVYAKRGPNRYVLLDTWSVSVPGLPGTQPLTDLEVLPGGYLAGAFFWLSADLSQTVGGVVVLDRSGALVAVWEPTEQVDEGWGVVPISLSQPTPGTLLTTAVQCSAGGCSVGKLFGYAYELQLARSPGGGVSLEQTERWRSRELVAISSASALDLSHLIAFDGFSTSGAATNELTLSGERVLVGAELTTRIVGDIDAQPTRASRQQEVWLVAEADGITVLERYVRTDAGWERTKELLAEWGPEGPPDP